MTIKNILSRRFTIPKPLIIPGLLLVIFVALGSAAYLGNNLGKPLVFQSSVSSNQATTPVSSPYLSPNIKTSTRTNVDSDPIVNCGPGKNSKQYVTVKQSDCKNYVDCGFLNGTWQLILKSECENKQTVDYQNKLRQLSANTVGIVTISCVTEYGTYSYSGSTYEDAQSQCSDLQADTKQWKASSDAFQKGLQDMEDIVQPIPAYFEPLPPALPPSFCGPSGVYPVCPP